jgi:hypothetical protein
MGSIEFEDLFGLGETLKCSDISGTVKSIILRLPNRRHLLSLRQRQQIVLKETIREDSQIINHWIGVLRSGNVGHWTTVEVERVRLLQSIYNRTYIYTSGEMVELAAMI